MLQRKLTKYILKFIKAVTQVFLLLQQVESVKGKANSDKSKTKDKGKDRKEQPSGDSTKFLHLMAFAELNSLLHPGGNNKNCICMYFI